MTQLSGFGKWRRFRALVLVFRCRRDARHLSGLPDYLLADVGLTRSQIVDAVWRSPFYGGL